MHQNSPFLYWFVGFGVTSAAVIAALAVRQARQRTRDLAAVAQQMGFTFLGKNWRGPVLSPQFKTSLLQRASGGVFSNVMTGSTGGLQVSIFDYTYGTGKNSVTLTLACFSQEEDLPPFELRPENIFDKIGDAVVHSDIDFDSNPEFSRRYHLRGPDETRIRMLFSPSLLAYLEQIPPVQNWHVEASGTSLIIYRQRWPAKATEVPALLNEASAIARTILASAGVKVKIGGT
ncbi:MAG TPA: hypothetical protein VMD99_03220 [Terriglobales bacterium]|nr:hypothetical protein [Terriglobales bacterium]